jgi:DNA ligase-4
MSSIQRLYNRCTPLDQRWIVRVILKGSSGHSFLTKKTVPSLIDLLISVKETTVFSVFHPDAQALFNTCSDLKRVAYELWDLSHRLNPEDKEVQIFQAFAPMLCKRPLQAIEATVKKMGGTEFLIEEKLDGERMQLHKRGSEYFYCSRYVFGIIALFTAVII